MLAMLLLLQSFTGPPADEPVATLVARAHCEAAKADEITVCGAADQETFRLRPLPARDERARPPRAEAQIAPGVKSRARVEKAPLETAPVTRLMVDVSVAF